MRQLIQRLVVTSHREKWISGIGSFAGIFAIFVTSSLSFEGIDHLLIVASMGASAVLLFAVPHSPLGQPWNVFGGHIISATIGVTCAQWIPDLWVAGSLAVGGAILVMHYLDCLHPPGGASALVAVVGGATIHNTGYMYVLQPVALNALVISLIAFLYNYLFSWRRYPASLVRQPTPVSGHTHDTISHADLVYALSQIDSFVDISEDDLLEIYELATQRAHPQKVMPRKVVPPTE